MKKDIYKHLNKSKTHHPDGTMWREKYEKLYDKYVALGTELSALWKIKSIIKDLREGEKDQGKNAKIN